VSLIDRAVSGAGIVRVQSFLVSDGAVVEIVQRLSYWNCRGRTMLDDLISLATLEDLAGGVQILLPE
jgi:hypothetical protein